MSGILRLGQGVRDPEGTGKVSGILKVRARCQGSWGYGQGVRDPEGTGKVSGILRVRARCQGS